jgi:hypothetical protein
MRLAALVLAGAVTALPAGADVPSAPIYAVVRMSTELSDDDVVGHRRAGLICAPAGAIRWADIGAKSSTDQRETVQDVLEDAGIAVTPFGEVSPGRPAETARRIRGAVTAATFKLCARHWAIGDANALSGDAAIDIDWRIEGRAGIELHHSAHLQHAIDPAHAASLGAIYRALLKDAARDLATWLQAQPTT